MCTSLTQTHGDNHCGVCVCVCVCSVECVACMCMCLRVWCMTQWVSWVCWRCLPKLQRGWRFSTNPASLEGAPYPNHSVFPMQPAIISEREGERMREKQVHRRLCVHSFCAHILQTEINLLTSPERLHANALLTPKCHASSNLVLPILLSLPLSFGLFLFCLSFPPFLFRIPPISPQRCTADVSSQEALCTSECHK